MTLDENDVIYHPQTGERHLIPQVCKECGSDDLQDYTPQFDTALSNGWRVCRECSEINGPIPEEQVCSVCGGTGGFAWYARGQATSLSCGACGGTGVLAIPAVE